MRYILYNNIQCITTALGVVRFRDRVYKVMNRRHTTSHPPDEKLLREIHKLNKKVTLDIDSLRFNTAISALMVFTNLLTAPQEL